MTICVVGTGYVGLVAGTCLAETGHDVICVDNNPAKVAMLQGGKSPIYEPGLEELLDRNIAEGRLTFTGNLPEAMADASLVYIAVSTPEGEDGSANLGALWSVCREMAPCLTDYKVVVIKSTVPVGTNDKVTAFLKEAGVTEVDVVSNPEFLKEGTAIDDFLKPDRLIIGVRSQRAKDLLNYVYEPLVRTQNPILFMDPLSAEMSKYASNAFLATRVSFMNEMSRLCQEIGADIDAVRQGMGSDKRIGPYFLFPGVGYGGSCFPKDISALRHMGESKGIPMELVGAVDAVNDRQKRIVQGRVKGILGEDLTGVTIAIWGLSFKPGTDDMREAPSLVIIEDLLKAGATIRAYDPIAMDVAKGLLGDRIHFADTNYDALDGADALIVVTEWNEFRRPDFGRIKDLMTGSLIIDGRNVLDPQSVRGSGFHYLCIGRPGKEGGPL